LKKEEGGRHTPFFTGYKPQFYVRTTDVTGEVTLADGVEMVMPGDTVTFKVKLGAPIALEDKQRLAIREGGKTVGAGVVRMEILAKIAYHTRGEIPLVPDMNHRVSSFSFSAPQLRQKRIAQAGIDYEYPPLDSLVQVCGSIHG
jgi:hypothetical protein